MQYTFSNIVKKEHKNLKILMAAFQDTNKFASKTEMECSLHIAESGSLVTSN